MRRRAAHLLVLVGKTKIKTGITKSLLVRGPEGKMVDLEVLSVGFK